ncbi:MAG: ThuA domain-containing protein [Planctomycetaceae bacterium]
MKPSLFFWLTCSLWAAAIPSSSAPELNLLFMGDNGHHRPEARFQELAPALESRGIDLKYTDRMEDLTPETLAKFDGLVLYANIDRIEDAQAKAVLDYVASGKGFIPLHCATYCWRNNKDIVALMGGQFQRHGGQVFTTVVAEPNHPIMKGYGSFTSWDETYIHHLHNEENRTVLEYRVEGDQAEGKDREPWTWVRTHGKGRVFYTAWGHDQRTFNQPGYHNLVERGIRWACGDDPSVVPAFTDPDTFAAPKMTELRKDVAPFEYIDVGPKIPNYTPGSKWGVQGKPRTTMQLPLPSEESIKHFVTPEGMAVRLYADERNFLAKPIAMNWDERGRLWICETVDYPNELGTNRDRIRICEDTDGDHVADKFTVFAEGLSIPTAIVIVRGGAVVQNGTETIYLKDTDGDDVSDQKTTLITGWALGDTHGGVSNFRYGLDNWIWAMQGYNNSTPQYDGKTAQSFRMGFWRFKLSNTDPPKVTELEFIRSSNNNTWGLGISEDGLIFGSTANHNPSMFVPIPNRYYESVKGWAPSTLGTIADSYLFKPITENVRQVDQFGGYTAGAGHALYTARTFPQQWWNKTAFVCGPTGHLVGTFVLRRDGADYKSTSPINLLASDDEWSAPIMAEVGPDGAVWVIDWYNYIVQHNPTPQGFETGKGNAYESDLRDKKHGRIYRVVAVREGESPAETHGRRRGSAGASPSRTGDILHEYSSLADASTEQLVDVLKHPSFMWRLHAQRLLIERSADEAVPALLERLSDESVDEIGLNVGAIHALHTLKGLGVIDGDKTVAAADLHRPLGGGAIDVSAAVRRQHVAPGVSPGTGTLAPEGRQISAGGDSHRLVTENSASPGGAIESSLRRVPAAPAGAGEVEGAGTGGYRHRQNSAVPPGLNRSAGDNYGLERNLTPILTSLPAAADKVLAAIGKALTHPSPGVRRNALSVLPRDEQGISLLAATKMRKPADEDPQVQLQWILTVADLPLPKDGEEALHMAIALAGWIDQTNDPVLLDALTAAAATYAPLYLNMLCEEPVPEGARMLGFAVPGSHETDVRGTVGANNLKVARRVAEHIGRSRPDAATLQFLVSHVPEADANLANAILDGLTAGIPSSFEFETTDAFDKALVGALNAADGASRSKLVRLAAQCGTKALDAHAAEIVKSMLAVVEDMDAKDADRVSAAKDLIGFRPDDADVVGDIVEQLNAQTTPELGKALLQAIQGSKSAAAGDGLVEAMPALTPQLKSAAIGTLLSRPDWVKSLLAGIEGRDIELSDLSLDQKQALQSFPDRDIKAQAEKLLAMGGGLPDANRDKVLKALLHLCEEEGDVDAGREMFKKHCMKCHKHGDMGDRNIGPNLTGMAVHPKEELLTHIIDPSRSVEGNFRIYTVVDIDGRVKNGMLASETRTSITLIDTEAKETSIQREDIDELVASKKSVMPEGFEKQMTEAELSNLLEFLTNKGRYVPVPLDRYATAVSTKGLFHNGDNGPDRVVFADWAPKMFKEVPFLLTDPRGKTVPNIILLHGPQGSLPPSMPKSVTLPCNTAAKAIHLLSGVGGWSFPAHRPKSVSMTVRLHYADGQSEDHPMVNGVHFADYIRRVDVPGSEFAFDIRGQQIRYLSIQPKRATKKVATIELVKGDDPTAPIVVAVTIER